LEACAEGGIEFQRATEWGGGVMIQEGGMISKILSWHRAPYNR